MDNVIEINNLNKSLGKFSLNNITFSVPEGCVAGFIGLNGQGKTTTIRTMLGLSIKDSGQVNFFGLDMDKHEGQIKDDIGVVFDEGYLYDSLSMKDMKNVVSSAYSKWDEEKYKRLMKEFGLDERQKIAILSKGMKMKYSLVLALSHHAKLLIMDEPTSGLDPLIRKQLLEILGRYMIEEGKGVFYSSHITSDLDKFADIIVFIDKGKIVFSEEKDSLIESHRIVKGDRKYITPEIEKLFIDVKISEFGFAGVTNRYEEICCAISNTISERVNIEDLMLAYAEGEYHDKLT